MKNIEGQLADADRRLDGLSLAKLKSEMEVRKSKFEEKNANFIKLRANLRRILAMLKQRQDNWVHFRDAISRGTSKKFDKYMANNKFTGKLKFRHSDQRLEIAVLQNEKGASRASHVTDMKELSGGERSYTQVSLLLALGESIECPFRVMDEFDVFMDSVNRDMTIQLLVDAAKKAGKMQFIFVTPNDLSTLPSDPMVKVQKMDPPRDRDTK